MQETTDIPENEACECCSEIPAKEAAEKLTNRFVLWSMGGSLIPIALLDIAAVIGVQIKLIAEMSKIYGVPFEKNRMKAILASLIGSLGLVRAGAILFGSVVKLIPGIGHLIGAVSVPIVVGAITYATGKIFIAHFESGGTLLSFNAETAKESFKAHFEEGKTVASDIQSNTDAEPTKRTKK
jgi:uncharacterized protein (DUF697 family)